MSYFDHAGLSLFDAIKTFYGKKVFAFSFLIPKDIRQPILAIYTFVKLCDGFVSDPEFSYEEFRTTWKEAYETKYSKDKRLNRIARSFCLYKITYEESLVYIKTLLHNQDIHQFNSERELTEFQIGTAGIISTMCIKVIGLNRVDRYPESESIWKKEFSTGISLAIIIQQIFFLRNAVSHVKSKGKVYIPSTLLEEYGLKLQDLALRDVEKVTALKIFSAKKASELEQLLTKVLENSLDIHQSVSPALTSLILFCKKILTSMTKLSYDPHRTLSRREIFKFFFTSVIPKFPKKSKTTLQNT